MCSKAQQHEKECEILSQGKKKKKQLSEIYKHLAEGKRKKGWRHTMLTCSPKGEQHDFITTEKSVKLHSY